MVAANKKKSVADVWSVTAVQILVQPSSPPEWRKEALASFGSTTSSINGNFRSCIIHDLLGFVIPASPHAQWLKLLLLHPSTTLGLLLGQKENLVLARLSVKHARARDMTKAGSSLFICAYVSAATSAHTAAAKDWTPHTLSRCKRRMLWIGMATLEASLLKIQCEPREL